MIDRKSFAGEEAELINFQLLRNLGLHMDHFDRL